MDKLENCPKCGGDAVFEHIEAYSSDSDYDVVQCTSCKLQLELDKITSGVYAPTPDYEKGMRGWNDQPKIKHLETQVAQLQDTVEQFETLIDHQHECAAEAIKLWQRAHNQPDTLLDTGVLIKWLVSEIENKQYTITCASEENQQLKEQLAEARAEIERLKAEVDRWRKESLSKDDARLNLRSAADSIKYWTKQAFDKDKLIEQMREEISRLKRCCNCEYANHKLEVCEHPDNEPETKSGHLIDEATKTPRTRAAIRTYGDYIRSEDAVSIEFAEQLETELAEALAEIERLNKNTRFAAAINLAMQEAGQDLPDLRGHECLAKHKLLSLFDLWRKKVRPRLPGFIDDEISQRDELIERMKNCQNCGRGMGFCKHCRYNPNKRGFDDNWKEPI